jgi:ParB family chromosome partitioning protein
MKELKDLALVSLRPGQYQPRRDFDPIALNELAQSIAAQGLIEPIVVRPITEDVYEIIAGERRYRAACLLGLKQIACLVGHYSDREACALTLVENIQRQDLNLIEEASAYRRLMDEFHYRQEEVAAIVSKSRSHVANILRLLSLSEPVKQLLCEGKIAYAHARLLVTLPVLEQDSLATFASETGCSVRELEARIKNQRSAQAEGKKDRDLERLEQILAEQVGAPVQIVNGWLQLKFFDNETLAGLLERLGLRYD